MQSRFLTHGLVIIPPPMPKDLKQVRRKDVISETDEAFKEHAEQQRKIPNDLKALQLKCARFARIVYEVNVDMLLVDKRFRTASQKR